ncbi:hypothetical protein ABS767_14570 [Sphingomonas sp. ST-64]|uniref:Uncharacterized protein n=1 Tax=Sphingomonas plantiphila TaxID=3163295 RepID=A0ABW8YT10_9SPHN
MLSGQSEIGLALIVFGGLLFAWGIQIHGMRLWQTWWRGRPCPFGVNAGVLNFDYKEGASVAGITWKRGFSHVFVDIRNESAKTVQDIDVLFIPEHPIIHSSASSEFADCRIGPLMAESQITVIYEGADGNRLAEPIDRSKPGNFLIGPFHRMRCDSLPSGARIRVNLATVVVVTPPVEGRLWARKRSDPKNIRIVINWSENGWDYVAEQEMLLTGNANA